MAVFTTGGQAVERVNYVEWLKGTGTQHFNLGFAPNQDTEFEIKVKYDTKVGNGWFFGGGKTWANNAFYAGIAALSFGSWASTLPNVNAGVPVVVSFKNLKLAYDGSTIATVTNNTFQSALDAYLFGVSVVDAADEFFVGEIYYFKLYDKGVLIRDMWPCYDPNGVPSMYDKVEKKYYYNAGTGVFTAG